MAGDLEPVRHAAEGRCGRRDRFVGEARGIGDRAGHDDVGQVVAAPQADVTGTHDLSHAAAATEEDAPVLNPRAVARNLTRQRSPEETAVHRRRERAAGLVVRIEDGDIVRPLAGEDVPLEAHILIPVELVEVVGGDVGNRGNRRRALGVLELRVADFEDHRGGRRNLIEPAEKGLTDVAADDVFHLRPGGHRAHKRGCGRLAARTRDPNHATGAELQEEPHLRRDGDAERAGAHQCRAVPEHGLGDRNEVETIGIEERAAGHEHFDTSRRRGARGRELRVAACV